MKPYIALYTESPGTRMAPLLVLFANRDARTEQDVQSTREALEADGEGVHIREYDRLSDVREQADPHADTVAPQPENTTSTDAIHQCLKMLAGMCDGARTLDGAGFSKFDAEFGRSLAMAGHLTRKQAAAGLKLVRKYHRQLPDDILKLALDEPIESVPADPGPEPGPLTPAQALNRKHSDNRGDTYQSGIRPGPRKLEQFREVLALMGTPALYSQEDKGENAIVHVKLFDPCGSWTWYITEFSPVAPDGTPNLAFGLVHGFEKELGYIDLEELSNVAGSLGIGIEIDMHFTPRPLKEIQSEAD